MISKARTCKTYNSPKWRGGWTDNKTGKPMQGFWYVFHGRKQVNLSRYGAVREELKPGSARYLSEVAPAYQAWVDEQEQLAQAKQEEETRPVTVADVLNLYIAEHLPRTSENYQALSTVHLNNFATGADGKGVEVNGVKRYSGWGALPADSLTDTALDTFRALHPKWGAGGTKCAIAPIKAAFAFAVKKHLIATNPLAGYELPNSGRREAYFSEEEETKFRDAIQNPHYATFFSACMELGVRPGEIATLTRKHIVETRNGGLCWRLDWEEWKCGHVTKRSRTIYLPTKWIDWTRERMKEIKDGEPLFTTSGGEEWNRHRWDSAFKRVRKASGVNSSLVQYSTRHTFITRALKKGWSASKVAAFCGTSESQIREHYSHLIDEAEEMVALVESVGGN